MLKEILILFAPGAAGLLFYKFLEKDKWGVWAYIENYSLFTFAAYFLARTLFYLSGLQEFSIRELDLNVQIKFGILGVVCAVSAAAVCHFGKAAWKNWAVRKHCREELHESGSLGDINKAES